MARIFLFCLVATFDLKVFLTFFFLLLFSSSLVPRCFVDFAFFGTASLFISSCASSADR